MYDGLWSLHMLSYRVSCGFGGYSVPRLPEKEHVCSVV